MSGEKKYSVSMLQQTADVNKGKEVNPDGFKYAHRRERNTYDYHVQQRQEQQEDNEWVTGLLKGKIVEGTENYPTDYLRN